MMEDLETSNVKQVKDLSERIKLESGWHKHSPSVDHDGITLDEIVVMMVG